MASKISFITFFFLDLFFIVSGLMYLETQGEAMYALLFFIFVWYAVWSVSKIIIYFKEEKKEHFLKFYFAYLINVLYVIANDKRLGPNKFIRVMLMSLCAIFGILTLVFLVYENISSTQITQELLIRYSYVFLYTGVYPLGVMFIQTLITQNNLADFSTKVRNFFPLRYAQLFLYMFTFFTPLGWLMIAFLCYLGVKGKTMNSKKS